MEKINYKKYIGVFIITAMVFLTAIYISGFFNNLRLEEIRSLESRITIDLLSSETQYILLQEAACPKINEPVLSKQLNELALKLEYGESRLLFDTREFLHIKQYYTLLQIKDYLLMKKIDERCGTKTVFILYFYSNKGDCVECEKMGAILTHLRKKYPKLRVYSFDYHLDLSALNTLISIYNIRGKNLPVVIINGMPYSGFMNRKEIEKLLPEEITGNLSATTTEQVTEQ